MGCYDSKDGDGWIVMRVLKDGDGQDVMRILKNEDGWDIEGENSFMALRLQMVRSWHGCPPALQGNEEEFSGAGTGEGDLPARWESACYGCFCLLCWFPQLAKGILNAPVGLKSHP